MIEGTLIKETFRMTNYMLRIPLTELLKHVDASARLVCLYEHVYGSANDLKYIFDREDLTCYHIDSSFHSAPVLIKNGFYKSFAKVPVESAFLHRDLRIQGFGPDISIHAHYDGDICNINGTCHDSEMVQIIKVVDKGILDEFVTDVACDPTIDLLTVHFDIDTYNPTL